MDIVGNFVNAHIMMLGKLALHLENEIPRATTCVKNP
jgi:hypothetical protein